MKGSTVDVFATFDAIDEDGNSRRCSRGEYVKAEIDNGRDIQIITLDELLRLLGTSLTLSRSTLLIRENQPAIVLTQMVSASYASIWWQRILPHIPKRQLDFTESI